MEIKTNLKTGLVISVFLLGMVCTTAVGEVRYVDANGSADFETIQDAINNSNTGDEIIVAEGTYVENINFDGKNIVLRGTDPNDSDVVAATIINGNDANSVVTFSGTESSSCVLSGFTITDGNAPKGGGIYGNGTIATIEKNIISGNLAKKPPPPLIPQCYGGGLYDCDGLIQNNIITANGAAYMGHGGGLYDCDGTIWNNIISYNMTDIGGGLSDCDSTNINNLIIGNFALHGGALYNCDGTIINCTVVGNEKNGLEDCNGPIKNCIIWHNDPDGNDQLYDCNTPSYSCIEDWNDEGIGNISGDPCFASIGYWQWQGTSFHWWDWIDNTGDYHLKSQAGRWYRSVYTGLDPTDDNFINLLDYAAFAAYWREDSFAPTWDDRSGPIPADLDNNGVVDFADLQILLDNYPDSYIPETWVPDDVTSVCIDAGDANTPIGSEPDPNGGIINMGAYGGTSEASKSY